MKEMWDEVPLFVRFFTISSTILLFFVWLLPKQMINLVNIPKTTIKEYKLWTLLTASFINIRFINYLFAFFAWIPDAMNQEKERGTIKYMFNFFLNTTIIQAVFLLFCFLVGFVKPAMMEFPSAGLWPIILADITLNCLGRPNDRIKVFLVPIPVPAKFVPWGLFVFIELINSFEILLLDMLAGIFYGYFYFYVIRNKLDLTFNFLMKLQDSVFKPLSNFSGYVPVNPLSASQPFASDLEGLPNLPSADNLKAPFQGQSTTIGDSVSNTISNMKDSVSNKLGGMKDSVSNSVSNIKESASSGVSGAYNGIKDSASNAVSGVKDSVSGAYTSVKDTTSNIVSGVKDSVSGAATGMKDAVSDAASSLKVKVTN